MDLQRPMRIDKWAIQSFQLKLWIARDNDSIIGYCAHMVHDHPIFAEKWASCFAIYVQRAYIHSVRAFIKQIEADLVAMNVDHVTYSSPNLSSFAPFLESKRMGYTCDELVMGKDL